MSEGKSKGKSEHKSWGTEAAPGEAKGQSRRRSVEKLSFEDAMGELENLVEQIEGGEIGLEEAIQRYERGIALIQRCRRVLDSAEQRIAELTTSAEGELKVDEQTDLGAQTQDDEEESQGQP